MDSEIFDEVLRELKVDYFREHCNNYIIVKLPNDTVRVSICSYGGYIIRSECTAGWYGMDTINKVQFYNIMKKYISSSENSPSSNIKTCISKRLDEDFMTELNNLLSEQEVNYYQHKFIAQYDNEIEIDKKINFITLTLYFNDTCIVLSFSSKSKIIINSIDSYTHTVDEYFESHEIESLDDLKYAIKRVKMMTQCVFVKRTKEPKISKTCIKKMYNELLGLSVDNGLFKFDEVEYLE